jgi:hypothetical protein
MLFNCKIILRYDAASPELMPMPGEFSQRLNTFESLLVLRCFRIDRITLSLTVCIIYELKMFYISNCIIILFCIFYAQSEIS